MALPNIFNKEVSQEVINRITELTHESQPKWGKMSVAQMLAHCCVTYEYVYDEGKYKKPGMMMGLVLKLLLKPSVTNEVPYKHNLRTGPDFLISDERTFSSERDRLIGFIIKTQELGATHFDGKASHSFGLLKKEEWNNMFYKHLDHHLTQFGV